MLTRAQVIAHLAALPERELMELLHELFRGMSEDKTFENGEYSYERYCVAATSYGVFQGIADPPYVQLVGQVAPSVAHVDWNALCQSGRCGACGVDVLSVAKVALCPVCSTEVQCT